MKKEKNEKEKAEETPVEEPVEEKTENSDAETEKRIEEAIAEEKDRFIRLYADFENYKKRTAAEKESSYLNATAQTLAEILPVVDNLERAVAATEEDSPLK